MRNYLKDLFIPHEGNGFKPNFLERFSLGVMLVLVLLSFAMANIQALLWVGSDYLVSSILPAVIIDLTNEARHDETLGTLTRSSTLDRAAQMKADDMAKHGYFAHYSPDGVSPWHWFDEASYDYIHAGENLAVYFTDSGDIVKAWMESPAHRANILSGKYTEIGVGTAKGEYGGFPTVFVVQLFGTPRVVLGASTDTVTLEVVTEPVASESADEEVAQASFETLTAVEEETSAPAIVPEEVVPVADIQSVPDPRDAVIVYSDLATTSRPGMSAVTQNDSVGGGTPSTRETPLLLRSATQPNMVLQIVYGFLALIVVLALVLSIVIEWRRQHPMQIGYAGGMLAVMAFLLYIHTILTSGVTIL